MRAANRQQLGRVRTWLGWRASEGGGREGGGSKHVERGTEDARAGGGEGLCGLLLDKFKESC